MNKMAFVRKNATKKTKSAEAGVKKPHRWKRGTVALRDIRKQQRKFDMLISRAPYMRMVREEMDSINQECSVGGKVERVTKQAAEALMEGTQAFLIDLFEKGLKATIHGKRVVLLQKDLEFAVENFGCLDAGCVSI